MILEIGASESEWPMVRRLIEGWAPASEARSAGVDEVRAQQLLGALMDLDPFEYDRVARRVGVRPGDLR